MRMCLLTAMCLACVSLAVAQTTRTVVLANEGLRLEFQLRPDGIDWTGLTDLKTNRQLLAPGEPLWLINADGGDGRSIAVTPRENWARVSITTAPARAILAWADPQASVTCTVELAGPRTIWSLAVANAASATLRRVTFPRVVTRPFGEAADDAVVFPRGPGERRVDPFARPVRYASEYPTGWGAYQFMTHYDPAGGLYVATHDPVASTKRLETRTLDGAKGLLLAFEWPAADASIAGNDFAMPGPAVIEVFRGDWFDAAQIYREWASREARWWPRDERRPDTPDWMRDVAIWAMTGGATQSVVGPVSEFARFMDAPTALHWYNWHEIPFDVKYPHYFPPKPDFAEGVAALKKAGVRVMPYINGRLWDIALEDFQATGSAAATKNEKGEPYIEEYGSGAKLAAMCPTTPLWRETVTSIVLRLMGECGVDGVYIDQVAAAAPRLCFDRAHGHPLAGGHWWTTQGYWPLLEALQAEMARRHDDRMITTECNAEPYIHLFDACLTWHWQHDGQAPVFPAIYGGVVQMFGRAYRGGPTKELADRMKAGQSLVFGEQIGWMGPDIIRHPVNGPFMRRMARLRHVLREFLAEGRMMRPPRLEGAIPDVTADWQWSGQWPVTLRAIQSGAWRARDGRLALIFVNVTSDTQACELVFDGKDYGMPARDLVLLPRMETNIGAAESVPNAFRRPIRLPPCEATVLEIR